MLQLRKDVMKDIRSLCVTKSCSFRYVMEVVDQIDSLVLDFGTVKWLYLLTFWRNILQYFMLQYPLEPNSVTLKMECDPPKHWKI